METAYGKNRHIDSKNYEFSAGNILFLRRAYITSGISGYLVVGLKIILLFTAGQVNFKYNTMNTRLLHLHYKIQNIIYEM